MGALILASWGLSHANPETTVPLPGGATIEMVWIAPGTFTMGSSAAEPGRYEDEGPQHQVAISQGFWLGKYELTQGQWQTAMGTAPWSGQDYVQENPYNPAVWITWNDVQALCQLLNQAAGTSMYRLPTEAEWEYACRAGTTTIWSFGDDEGRVGEYAWTDYHTTVVDLFAQPVGMKLPNPWGLYDMHGNVWEMCQDWYGRYASGAQTDPTGPTTGSDRVERGGSWYDYSKSPRSAVRNHQPPDGRNCIFGARLVWMGSAPTAVAPATWGEVKEQAR